MRVGPSSNDVTGPIVRSTRPWTTRKGLAVGELEGALLGSGVGTPVLTMGAAVGMVVSGASVSV